MTDKKAHRIACWLIGLGVYFGSMSAVLFVSLRIRHADQDSVLPAQEGTSTTKATPIEDAVVAWRGRPWYSEETKLTGGVVKQAREKYKAVLAIHDGSRKRDDEKEKEAIKALWRVLNKATGRKVPTCVVRSGDEVWFVRVSSRGDDLGFTRFAVDAADVLIVGDIKHVKEGE